MLSSSYKPMFTSPARPGTRRWNGWCRRTRAASSPRETSTSRTNRVFIEDQAHNLTASVFSDYSGDVGTVYDVPSSSTVVGDVTYIPTPGVKRARAQPGQPGRYRDPGKTLKMSSAAVTFIKWYDEAGQPGRLRRSQRAPPRLSAVPAAGQRRWSWTTSSSRARSPAQPSWPPWPSTTRGLYSRPARRRGTRPSAMRSTPTSTAPPLARKRGERHKRHRSQVSSLGGCSYGTSGGW